MAAALHVLLLQRPQKASDLAAATFWDLWGDQVVIPGHPGLKEFPTPSGRRYHIDLPYLIRRHAQMWTQKHAAGAFLDPNLFTDFCVSRALGYLLKVIAPGRYDSEKCDFNKFFGPQPTVAGRKQFTRAGAFALRTDTLAFILRDILGAQEVTIAHNCIRQTDNKVWEKYYKHREYSLAGVERKKIGFDHTTNHLKTLEDGVSQMVNGIARELQQGKFVIAAIDARLIGPYAAPPGDLKYNHWVVIKRATRTLGPIYSNDLKIWSWGQADDYTGKTDAEVRDSIYDLIVGRFWSPASA
jgi:hypothetical protein